MAKKVIAVGNAIVDIFCEATDDMIAEHDLEKGVMNEVTADQLNTLQDTFSMSYTSVGGSVLNTVDTLAKLGAECSFITSIGCDTAGKKVLNTIRQLKIKDDFIAITNPMRTSRSLIMVTPDGQRTMCTLLDSVNTIEPIHVAMSAFLDSDAALVEGYLLDGEGSADAAWRAVKIIGSQSLFGTITLCDRMLVERHREKFQALLQYCPFVVGNINEFQALFGVDSEHDTIQAAKSNGLLNCITMSERGAIIVQNDEIIEIPPYSPTNILDTTGAGDQFLAGFLFGRLLGVGLSIAGRAGTLMGGSVVEQIGGTFHRDVKQIIERLKIL